MKALPRHGHPAGPGQGHRRTPPLPRRLTHATLLTLSVGMAACTDTVLEIDPQHSGQGAYIELWETFDRGYAPFGVRGVDWSAAFDRHLPPEDSGDEILYESATALLAELDDGHVTLLAPGRPLFVAKQTFRERAFDAHLDLGIVFRQMVDGPFSAGASRYGRLPDSIGYVHVANWNDPVPDLDDMMDYFSALTAVIVDLRHNPGGDFTHGFPFAARFADASRLAFVTETKVGPAHNQLGQRVEWRIEPSGGQRFDGAVAVLTNGYTNSAAERTLMAFRTMPHATTLGSRTAGNHGEKVGSQLSNGWRYSIVPQVVTDPDGRSFEGPGLPPDLEVTNTAEEIANGFDRQFETALDLLRGSSPP